RFLLYLATWFFLASPHRGLRSFGCMINETLTVRAARKSCQGGVLCRIGALNQQANFGIKHKMQFQKSAGTNRKARVSKAATANPPVWNGQGPSATPIPSPGGTK